MKNLKYVMVLLTFLGGITSAVDVSIEFTAAGDITITPQFDFTTGTVKVYIDNVYEVDLTSGVAGSIAVLTDDVIKYTASDWDSITKIDIQGDQMSGDISGWTLPNSLTDFFLASNLLSGDISGWTLPNSLVNLFLESNLLSGDISGWTLPNSLARLVLYSTSISYESSAGAIIGVTNNLVRVSFNNCLLPQVQVDNILADCVASGIDDSSSAKEIDVGDNNASPSILGLNSKELLEARGWTTRISAFTTVYANGVIDNVMFFSRELDQHDVDFLWNGGNGREDWEPFLGRLNRPLDYPYRRGRYTF